MTITHNKKLNGYIATQTKQITVPIISEYNNIIGHITKPQQTLIACDHNRTQCINKAVQRLLTAK